MGAGLPSSGLRILFPRSGSTRPSGPRTTCSSRQCSRRQGEDCWRFARVRCIPSSHSSSTMPAWQRTSTYRSPRDPVYSRSHRGSCRCSRCQPTCTWSRRRTAAARTCGQPCRSRRCPWPRSPTTRAHGRSSSQRSPCTCTSQSSCSSSCPPAGCSRGLRACSRTLSCPRTTHASIPGLQDHTCSCAGSPSGSRKLSSRGALRSGACRPCPGPCSTTPSASQSTRARSLQTPCCSRT
mmetsp:Transcript_78346/g.201735  ORF Transcript_78346/g.201735 Transcript_78346/m.201735 type:complete len:237 (+) Transcript_78346:378-1088(+)